MITLYLLNGKVTQLHFTPNEQAILFFVSGKLGVLFAKSTVQLDWTWVTKLIVYICDLNNNRIQVFDVSTRKFLTLLSDLFKPQDIKVIRDTIYILDKSNPCMHLYSLDHVLLKIIISCGESPSYQLHVGFFFCVDKWHIWIPDYVSHLLKVFDRDGNVKCIIGGEGSSDGNFLKPKSVAFCSSMPVVACNKHNWRIQIF